LLERVVHPGDRIEDGHDGGDDNDAANDADQIFLTRSIFKPRDIVRELLSRRLRRRFGRRRGVEYDRDYHRELQVIQHAFIFE